MHLVRNVDIVELLQWGQRTVQTASQGRTNEGEVKGGGEPFRERGLARTNNKCPKEIMKLTCHLIETIEPKCPKNNLTMNSNR